MSPEKTKREKAYRLGQLRDAKSDVKAAIPGILI
jgi:hypothetical protein